MLQITLKHGISYSVGHKPQNEVRVANGTGGVIEMSVFGVFSGKRRGAA